MPQYLYVVYNPSYDKDGIERYKFGRTNNLRNRLRSYKTGQICASEYKYCYQIDDVKRISRIENDIKIDLREYKNEENGGTEIFTISLAKLKEKIEKYLKNNEIGYTPVDTKNLPEPRRSEKKKAGKTYYIYTSEEKQECSLCNLEIQDRKYVIKDGNRVEYYDKNCIEELELMKMFPLTEFEEDVLWCKFDSLTVRKYSGIIKRYGTENFEYIDDPFVFLYLKKFKKIKKLTEADEELLAIYPNYVNSEYRTLAYYLTYLLDKKIYEEYIPCVIRYFNRTTYDFLKKYPINHTNINKFGNIFNGLLKIKNDMVYLHEYNEKEKFCKDTIIDIVDNNVNEYLNKEIIEKHDTFQKLYPKDSLYYKYIQKYNAQDITYINGCAGSGKSMLASAFMRLMYENGYNVIITAPTAKAAHSMGNEIFDHIFKDVESKWMIENGRLIISTIHGLGSKMTDVMRSKFSNYVIILDEVSMVDFTVSELLMNFIRKIYDNEAKNIKFIITGDEKQLPPIGIGCAIDILNAPDIKGCVYNIKLTENKRAENEEFVNMLKIIREEGKVCLKNIKNVFSFNLREEESFQISDKLCEEIYEKYKKDPDSIIITKTKKIKNRINNFICDAKTKMLPDDKFHKIGENDCCVIEGENIIINRNTPLKNRLVGYNENDDNENNLNILKTGNYAHNVDERLFNGQNYKVTKIEEKNGFNDLTFIDKLNVMEYYINKYRNEIKNTKKYIAEKISDFIFGDSKMSKKISDNNNFADSDWDSEELENKSKVEDIELWRRVQKDLTNFKYHILNLEKEQERPIAIKYFKFDKFIDNPYCVTIHKCQGRSYNNVIFALIFENNHDYDMDIRELYTALSRTRKTCTLYSNRNEKTIKNCVENYNDKMKNRELVRNLMCISEYIKNNDSEVRVFFGKGLDEIKKFLYCQSEIYMSKKSPV